MMIADLLLYFDVIGIIDTSSDGCCLVIIDSSFDGSCNFVVMAVE